MTSLAERAIVQAIADELAKVFPQMRGIDFRVPAKRLLDAVDLAAFQHMQAREEALQASVIALMKFYNSTIEDQQVYVKKLEGERVDLQIKLCALQTTDEPAPS